MNIRCPHCDFSRDVDPAKVPAGPTRVTCPKCRQVFTFTPIPMFESSKAEVGTNSLTGSTSNFQATEATGMPEELAKAGFWYRFVAMVLDYFLIFLIYVLGGAFLRIVFFSSKTSADHFLMEITFSLIMWAFMLTISITYNFIFIGYCGQTPGKMLLRIKVVRLDYSEVGFGTAALREIYGKLLSSQFLLGYLMVPFQPQKQAAHDKIADSYVIKL